MTISLNTTNLQIIDKDSIVGSGLLFAKPAGVDEDLWALLDGMDGVKDNVVTEAVLNAADEADGARDGVVNVNDLNTLKQFLDAKFNANGGEVTQEDYKTGLANGAGIARPNEIPG